MVQHELGFFTFYLEVQLAGPYSQMARHTSAVYPSDSSLIVLTYLMGGCLCATQSFLSLR